MPTLSARTWLALMFACLSVAPPPASAQTFPIVAPLSVFDLYPTLEPQCRAVQQLADHSWRTRQPVEFPRAIKVGTGAVIVTGTVVAGVDLGAVLDRACVGGEAYPRVRF